MCKPLKPNKARDEEEKNNPALTDLRSFLAANSLENDDRYCCCYCFVVVVVVVVVARKHRIDRP